MSTNNPFDNPWQDQPDPYSGDPANPYAASASIGSEAPSGDGISLPPGTTRGLVGQLPVLGILMIIQGALEGLVGILLILLGVFFPQFMEAQGNPAFRNMNNPGGPDVESVMLVVYGGLGILIAIVGLLHIVGGFNVYKCRGRILAFVSLGLGMCTLLTCYCFPTALALGIYGLIVLIDESVQRAMYLGRTGHSTDNIQRAFARL